MNRQAKHSVARVRAYVHALRRAGASDKLVKDFEEIIEIDNAISADESRDRGIDPIDDLLMAVCLRHGFSKVYDRGAQKAWLRPNAIGSDAPGSHGDVWSTDFDPKEEQAYRRGYDQGFSEARELAARNSKKLGSRQAEIHRWRMAKVWFGATPPGTTEPYTITVTVRSAIPIKQRWKIFERDSRRCVVCGASADDGVRLHVDHKLSLFKGGTNDPDNLQTLCEPCNLGKGAD